jgi:hypothetical protein
MTDGLSFLDMVIIIQNARPRLGTSVLVLRNGGQDVVILGSLVVVAQFLHM